MSVLRRVKLRTPDGIESIEYPLGVDAENVEVANGENLSQRLARIDEDLEKNEEDIAAVSELAGTNKQNIGANEIRIDALERRSASVDKKPYYFDTVADMKAYQGLKEGDMAITLGYYNINDGGTAEYIIDNTLKENSYQENILNNLYATLIIKNDTVNIHQFGAKGENGFDDTESLRKAIYFTNKPHTILFNAKKYRITNINVDYEHSAITLKGQNSHYKHYNFDNTTQIVPFVGMSGTMFSIGEKNVGVDKIAFGFTVKDICFSGDNVNSYQYNCFDFGYSSNVHFENVIFRRIGGNSLILNGCYDSLFDNVEFMDNGDKLSTNGEFSMIVKRCG